MDYEKIKEIICASEGHIFYQKPKHSKKERIEAAEQLSKDVSLQAYSICDSYFFLTGEGLDENSKSVAELMKLAGDRNIAAYAELLPHQRLQKIAREVLYRDVALDEELPKEKISVLLGYANMVNHCGVIALSPKYVKPVKTLNDIIRMFENISPFASK